MRLKRVWFNQFQDAYKNLKYIQNIIIIYDKYYLQYINNAS